MTKFLTREELETLTTEELAKITRETFKTLYYSELPLPQKEFVKLGGLTSREFLKILNDNPDGIIELEDYSEDYCQQHRHDIKLVLVINKGYSDFDRKKYLDFYLKNVKKAEKRKEARLERLEKKKKKELL